MVRSDGLREAKPEREKYEEMCNTRRFSFGREKHPIASYKLELRSLVQDYESERKLQTSIRQITHAWL